MSDLSDNLQNLPRISSGLCSDSCVFASCLELRKFLTWNIMNCPNIINRPPWEVTHFFQITLWSLPKMLHVKTFQNSRLEAKTQKSLHNPEEIQRRLCRLWLKSDILTLWRTFESSHIQMKLRLHKSGTQLGQNISKIAQTPLFSRKGTCQLSHCWSIALFSFLWGSQFVIWKSPITENRVADFPLNSCRVPCQSETWKFLEHFEHFSQFWSRVWLVSQFVI